MNEKKKRKAVIGTIVATGLAATMACSSPATDGSGANKASRDGSEQSTRVSAADRIVIDGEELDTGKLLTDTTERFRKLYGPPRPPKRKEDIRKAEAVYGPPPPDDRDVPEPIPKPIQKTQ